MKDDWFDLIVGNGNVGIGMLRFLAVIAIFILAGGTTFWWLMR